MTDERIKQIKERLAAFESIPWDGEGPRDDGEDRSADAFWDHATDDIAYLLEQVERMGAHPKP